MKIAFILLILFFRDVDFDMNSTNLITETNGVVNQDQLLFKVSASSGIIIGR